MYRLKIKNTGMDSPYIPDSGSRRPVPIKREMTTNRSGKMDTGNMLRTTNDDPKLSRTEIVPLRVPKTNVGIASDVVPNPEDLEPSSRKLRNRLYQSTNVGEEVQIKLRSAFSSNNKRKGIKILPMNLEDDTQQPIEARKVKNTKTVTIIDPFNLGDTRDVNNQNPNVLTSKAKVFTSGKPNTETFHEQDVQPKYNPLRTRKGDPNIPFAISSGFQCDFNPMIPEHRRKLKQAFNEVRIVIQQDPDVGISIVENLHFKSKKEGAKVVNDPEEDSFDVGIVRRPEISRNKKSVTIAQDVDTFDQVDVYKTPSSKVKRMTSRRQDVDTFDQVDVRKTPSSKVKRTTSRRQDVDTFDQVDVDNRRPQHGLKKQSHRSRENIEEDLHMDVSLPHLMSKEKNEAKAKVIIPENSHHIDIGHIKNASRVKKVGKRMVVSVTPFEGEVTISPEPLDTTKRKGLGEPNSIGNVNGGDEIQIEKPKTKVKRVKKPQPLVLELGPDDKDTDTIVEQRRPKNRAVKAELPRFEPSQDNQDIEIEKKKNILIFT